ncbi:MAG: helix-turn-helix domain-containing protein [Clostridia bacterium]|nr:helix-turn-helix domain-containing protein [Clostridia bacterium]
MALFDKPFSLEIPVQIGYLRTVFFINQNLFVTSEECISIPHNHHDYELRYIATGKCKQIISNRTYDAEVGDLLIVYPFEYHCQRKDQICETSSQYNLRFTVEIPNDNASPAEIRAYQAIIKALSETRRVHDKKQILLLYFKQLTEEINSKNVGYVSNMQSLCSLILSEVTRLSEKEIKSLYPPEELKFRGYGRSAIDSFFTHKYLTNVKVGDLAEDMKISRRQVNRIMNKMFGMSFTQKLTEMRLQQAKLQLTFTEKPITEICHDCGFQNYSYFSTCFKENCGMPPSEYRARTQKKKNQ